MKYEASLVPREALALIWPKAVEILAPALEYTDGREDLVSLYRRLAEARAQLWAGLDPANPDDPEIKAVAVTCLVTYPRDKALRIEYCGGGDMVGWQGPIIDLWTKFALDHGASRLELFGRKGWARELRDKGWTQPLVFMEKRLTAPQNKQAAA
jgi:hypothetical protein